VAIESFEKQSWEEFPIAGSILNVQESDETVDLNNSSVYGYDKDGNDVTTSIIDATTKTLTDDPDGNYTNNALKVRVKGGDEDGTPYKITFKLVTNKGNKWEIDVRMKIKEK